MRGSLYYGRAIDGTILPVINDISMAQANPTEGTKAKATMPVDYLSSHPKAKIRYLSSAIQLHVQSDTAYLVCVLEQKVELQDTFIWTR